jgi:hypothetical protein
VGWLYISTKKLGKLFVSVLGESLQQSIYRAKPLGAHMYIRSVPCGALPPLLQCSGMTLKHQPISTVEVTSRLLLNALTANILHIRSGQCPETLGTFGGGCATRAEVRHRVRFACTCEPPAVLPYICSAASSPPGRRRKVYLVFLCLYITIPPIIALNPAKRRPPAPLPSILSRWFCSFTNGLQYYKRTGI